MFAVLLATDDPSFLKAAQPVRQGVGRDRLFGRGEIGVAQLVAKQQVAHDK
jgi:hypothetical protein